MLKRVVVFCHLLAFSQCGLLKVDRDSNCLNPDATCFAHDVTKPSIVSSSPSDGTTLSLLPDLTIVFSEPMRDANLVSNYKLSGPGIGTLSLNSITTLSSTSVRLNFSGNVGNGGINIDMSNLKDLTGNTFPVSPPPTINLTGNTSIGITPTVDHNFVGTSGYQSVQITWSHDYTLDAGNNNDYTVKIGGTDCATALAAGSGTNLTGTGLAPATNVITTLPIANFPNPITYTVRICVSNVGNNRYGEATVTVTRDNNPPVSSASPGTGAYNAVQNITLNATDNSDKIAYTTAASPAVPTDPTFDAAGNITNGTLYTGTFATPHSTNPTVTNVKYRAIDKAGNVEATVHSETYSIDTSLPQINLVSNTHYWLSTGGFTATTVTWNTDISSPVYSVYLNPTSCDNVCGCTGGTAIQTGGGTTAAVNNLTNITAAALGAGSNSVRICAQNAGGSASAFVNVTLTSDNTGPTSVASSGSGYYPSGGTITFSVVDNGDKLIYNTAIFPSVPADPTFDANGNLVTGSLSNGTFTLPTNSRINFKWRSIDLAGNVEGVQSATYDTRNPWPVGGNITGLTASGLQLRNVSSDSSPVIDETITVAASSTNFQFTTAVTFNKKYEVTVAAQPTGQVCAFNNQFTSGTVNGNVTDLALNCVDGYLVNGVFSNTAALTNLSYATELGALKTITGTPFTIVAGNAPTAITDGTVTASIARFQLIRGLAVDKNFLYISDGTNHNIKKMDLASGGVRMVASSAGGGGTPCPGTNNTTCKDGTGDNVQFLQPCGLATDGTNLYVADLSNHRIRKINLASGQVVTIAGSGSTTSSDNTTALQGGLNTPRGLALQGNTLYISEINSHKIRRLNLSTGALDTIAGTGLSGSGDATTGTSATFSNPAGLAIAGGYLYVADSSSNKIRRIQLSGNFAVSTVAGDGTSGFFDGPPGAARFASPQALYSDGVSLYVGETYQTIRVISLSDFHVSSLIGTANGYADGAGGDGAALGGSNIPFGSGNRLFVADVANKVIRLIYDGLVARYALDDTISSGRALDSSGNGRDGAINGSPTTAIGIDGITDAMRFDGSSHISLPNTGFPTGAADHTFCVWAKPEIADGVIVSMGATSNITNGRITEALLMQAGAANVQFANWNLTEAQTLLKAPLNNWHHFCGKFAAGNATLFINGMPVSTVSKGPNLGNGEVHIGNLTDGSKFFQGVIADVRVYDRALSIYEITRLAAQVKKGLVRFYAMNNNPPYGTNADYNPIVSNWAVGAGVINPTVDRFGLANAAVNFNGSSWLNSAFWNQPYSTHVRTACVWAKASDNAGFRTLYTIGTAGSLSQFEQGLSASDQYNRYGTGPGEQLSSAYVPPLQLWMHFCSTFNGTDLVLFANGTRVAESTAAINTGTAFFRIGINSGLGNLFFGDMDDFRMYNRVLNPKEIAALAGYQPEQVSTWDQNAVNSTLAMRFSPEALPVAGITGVTWPDWSGNNYNMPSIGGGALSGIGDYFGVMNSVQFSSGYYGLAAAATGTLNFSGMTLFMVAQDTTGNDGSNRYAFSRAGSCSVTAQFNFLKISTGDFRFSTDTSGNAGVSPASKFIFSGVSATNLRGFTDGKEFFAVNATQITGAEACPIQIGNSNNLGTGQRFTGHIGEILLFRKDLSDTDRQLVECYLSSKTGIALNHPCN